jgi:hypothetical protein
VVGPVVSVSRQQPVAVGEISVGNITRPLLTSCAETKTCLKAR